VTTPRERVLAAIDGFEVYPVPVDVTTNLIHWKLENRLMSRLEIDDRASLYRVLGAHMRWANPKYIGRPLEKAPVQPHDPWPNKFAVKNIWGAYGGLNTYSDSYVERPLANVSSVSDVEEHVWPSPGWFEYGKVIPNLWYGTDCDVSVAQWAAENADYARVVGGYEPIFGRICDLCGIETALVLTATKPDIVHALVAYITDFLEAWYRGIAEAGQGHVDVLAYGDDFAGQIGMLLAPRKWREYFLDSWMRLFAVAHEHGMKTLFHSCGGIRPIIGDLVDAGMDILEVVQIRAKGMDSVELKQEFGNSLTYYGGVDVQHVLPNRTPQGIREEVRRLVDVFGPGGGYILTSSHLLYPDVPTENVLAMYDEAQSYIPDSVRSTMRRDERRE
jgi:uroporphyrinogen decarboxylase